MFVVLSVFDAHQRAVQLEKQQVHRNTGGINFGGSGAGTSNNSRRIGNMSFGGSGTGGASNNSSGRATIPPSTITKPIVPTHTTAPTTGFCCFNCGEPRHRFAECKK